MRAATLRRLQQLLPPLLRASQLGHWQTPVVRVGRDWSRPMSSSGVWLATAVGGLPAGGGAEALLSPGLIEGCWPVV